MKKIIRGVIISATVNILFNEIRKMASADTTEKMQGKLLLTDEKRAKLLVFLSELEGYEQVDPLVAPKNLMAGEIRRKTENIVIRSDHLIKEGRDNLVSFRVSSGGFPVEGAILCVQSCAGSFTLEPTDSKGETVAIITIPKHARDLVCIIKHEGGTASIWNNYFR